MRFEVPRSAISWNFLTLFPNTTIYKLEENYRSTQPVLQLANRIIENAPEKYSKELFTKKLEGPLPVLVQAVGENAQSRFIAQKILELREEGIALDEIAVLFRSSFNAFDLELELSRGVTFLSSNAVGSSSSRQRTSKTCWRYLRVMHNPLDTVSWNRILLLIEGVGPKKAKDVIAQLLNTSLPHEILKQGTGRSAHGFRHLASLLEGVMEQDSLTPSDLISETMDYYLPVLKDQYDDYPKRIRDLEHFSVMAERYHTSVRVLG